MQLSDMQPEYLERVAADNGYRPADHFADQSGRPWITWSDGGAHVIAVPDPYHYADQVLAQRQIGSLAAKMSGTARSAAVGPSSPSGAG